MSKRSDLEGGDGSNCLSQGGIVSNPLVYESSVDDKTNEGNESEMGPLQEQDDTGGGGDGAGQIEDTGAATIQAPADLLNSTSNDNTTTSADALSSSSPDNSSPTNMSSSSQQLSSRDQASSDETAIQKQQQQQQQQQRKRQLPLESDTGAGSDDVTTSMDDSSSTNGKPGGSGAQSSTTMGQDDSANTDQEVPVSADSAGNQNITWMPQNEQSLCEFSHTITEYSQKRDSGDKKAEYSDVTVDDRGNKWRLIVYVNGNGRASNHHLSLFLQVADADDLPFGWKKAVSYVLTLEHPDDGNLSYAKRNPDKTFKMCPKAIDWGWSQFITSDKIQQEGFIQSDALVVRASVTVKSSSVTIDGDDSELYLKCAVEEGRPDAVQLCLDQGASVNCQFKDDLYTPLHTACSISPADQDGGDDESAKGALHLPASLEGSMKVLELLLKEGADGNACNKWKETPLLIAANNGHKNAVEALLKFGADPALCSEAGWSALTFAAHKGYNEIVALLLNAGAPINCRVAEDASTPLHKACAGGKTGHFEAVKLLLDGGADVHALNKWRETPLLTAANHGQAGAVEALLRAGADPCKCTDTGWSPLSIAAYKGHNDVVKLLLDEGAPTEEADPTLSALLQAATKGLPDTVELLLQHGADHMVTTKKGDTALSILVEQNLIDAAVEMVTRYKASIPRCSRDRKKVQKARLLINLRSKKSVPKEDGDSSDDDGVEEGQISDLDASNDLNQGSKKSKRNVKVSAEEQAKAAEEALLMELELEDAERNKQEKEANKKLAKKRKKKEKERQMKKEEEEKKLAQERAEEKKRLQEAEKRELAEKAERDRLIAAQKKQEQEFLRKQAEDARQQQKEEEQRRKAKKEEDAKLKSRQKLSSANAASPNGRKAKSDSKNEERPKGAQSKGHSPTNIASSNPATSERSKPAVARKKRGWESLPAATTAAKPSLSINDKAANARSNGPGKANVVVSSVGNSARSPDNHSTSGEAVSAGTSITESSTAFDGQRDSRSFDGIHGAISSNNIATGRFIESLEPPSVAVFRREKVFELLHRCSLAQVSNDVLGCVDDRILRTVLLRWIDRSIHEESECYDSMIPSWKDSGKLVSFFQRQFITESRKGGRSGPIPSIESLKEAGTAVATLCQALGVSVRQYRQQVEQKLSTHWDDTSVGMGSSEIVRSIGNPTVIVDWSKQSQIHVASTVFLNLRNRYRGAPSRFLASMFVCKVCHDTLEVLAGETQAEWRLAPRTQQPLSRHLNIDAEVWSDPFSVHANNRFWGKLPHIDREFGGLEPFTFTSEHDQILRFHGGSILLIVPSDNMIASQYIRHATAILLAGSSAPLSFVLFLRPDCLLDGGKSFTINHLYAMEPLLAEHGTLIARLENLAAGQHSFFNEKLGASTASSTGSLFVVLQNQPGRTKYPVTDMATAEILATMEVERPYEQSGRSSLPFSDSTETYNTNGSLWGPPSDYASAPAAAIVPPSPLSHQAGTDAGFRSMPGPISSSFSSNNSPSGQRRTVPRRGRLFDLVDDGGDEDNMNDVVSGMLGTFNVDLFQNSGQQDVDIEAISLMGIGGSSLSGRSTLHPRGSSSSHGRFG